MLRSREEAESIARQKHGDLDERQIALIASFYINCFEWACKNCGNTGTVLKMKNGSLRSSDCMCKILNARTLNKEKIIKDSGIPFRYKDAQLANWINPGRAQAEIAMNNASYHVIHEYSSKLRKMIERGYGLYLTGPNGVGKTFLACAIANRAVSLEVDVKYFTMSTIVRTQISSWFEEDAKKTAIGIHSSTLLVIDDLDKIYKTKTGIETSLFDNLLRERLQSNKPCIFTSNRTIDDARSDFGPHIHSMLKEHCAEVVILGEDYRSNLSVEIRRKIINGD